MADAPVDTWLTALVGLLSYVALADTEGDWDYVFDLASVELMKLAKLT